MCRIVGADRPRDHRQRRPRAATTADKPTREDTHAQHRSTPSSSREVEVRGLSRRVGGGWYTTGGGRARRRHAHARRHARNDGGGRRARRERWALGLAARLLDCSLRAPVWTTATPRRPALPAPFRRVSLTDGTSNGTLARRVPLHGSFHSYLIRLITAAIVTRMRQTSRTTIE